MTQSDTTAALSDTALGWFQRALWALCIGVYLTVFVAGIVARGDELLVMSRAVGLTLVTAVLGKLALALLARATLPTDSGPSAEQAGPIGSPIQKAEATNVREQEDGAEAA